MENLSDYIRQNAQTPFSVKPLTVLDFTIFNELGYLGLIDHLTKDRTRSEGVWLHELRPLGQELLTNNRFDFLNTKERLALLDLVTSAKRYQHVRISHYVNDVNEEFERQFAAMVFSIPEENVHHIVFRGTDDSLIGWKEDFKLTYMSELPAHRAAVHYLNRTMPQLSGQVLISGHSKGGNLAVYAAANSQAMLKNRITMILVLDSPGFRQTFLSSEAYQTLSHRIVVIQPYESIVGVMLESDKQPLIVASRDKGIAQHMVLNWAVDIVSDGFVLVDSLSPTSIKLAQTFAIWNQSLPSYELKQLFDLLFDSLREDGIRSLNDLSLKASLELPISFDPYRRLTAQQKELFKRAIGLFIQAYRSSRSLSR